MFLVIDSTDIEFGRQFASDDWKEVNGEDNGGPESLHYDLCLPLSFPFELIQCLLWNRRSYWPLLRLNELETVAKEQRDELPEADDSHPAAPERPMTSLLRVYAASFFPLARSMTKSVNRLVRVCVTLCVNYFTK